MGGEGRVRMGRDCRKEWGKNINFGRDWKWDGKG